MLGVYTNSLIDTIKTMLPIKLTKININKFIWCTRNKVEEIRNIPRIVVDKNEIINTCKILVLSNL